MNYNVSLYAIKNIKDLSLNEKKQENVYWLDKTFILPDIKDCFTYTCSDGVSGRQYLRIFDEKNY